MLYYRRKILLALIEAFGGHLTAKQLQKYLFLFTRKQHLYLQPIITQYFIDNKSEIWLLFLIAHSKR